jgi:hypothetical protein
MINSNESMLRINPMMMMEEGVKMREPIVSVFEGESATTEWV